MTDIFTPRKRSEIMSRIKGKDTKPEKLVRSLLHRMGYRFRLHVKHLPGKPDIVLPRHHKVIFINGCFWHGHKFCKKGEVPETNKVFWQEKIEKNIMRDENSIRLLTDAGWKVCTIWECETKDIDKLSSTINNFMNNDGE